MCGGATARALLDEIVQFPPLQLGAGGVGSPTVQTATQQAAWRAWIVEADKVCFGALTRAAVDKVTAHKPATVIPIIFSAGARSVRVTTTCCRSRRTATDDTGCASSWARF